MESWIADCPTSSRCRIRVRTINEPPDGTCVFDINNRDFAITQPAVPLAPTPVSPANGETGVTTTPMLNWSDSTAATSYDVQVATDPAFSPLARSASSLTTSMWTVSPALNASTTYYWRARGVNHCGTGAWSAIWSFTTVSGASSIMVTAPNGGQNWPVGSMQTITWTGTNLSGDVELRLSRNGGQTYPELIRAEAPTGATGGSYAWTVGSIGSEQGTTEARVQVIWKADPSVMDTSDANFTISSIKVLIPNGGENWISGCIKTLTWEAVGVAPTENVRIQISRNYNPMTPTTATWQSLFSSTRNDGMEDWWVTGPASSQCRIRISSVNNPAIVDISDSNFTVIARTMNVLRPNSADVWLVGNTREITWDSNVCERVNIDLTRNNGQTWTRLFTQILNTGSQSWMVTGPGSTTCQIRISVPNLVDEAVPTFLVVGYSDVFAITETSMETASGTLGPGHPPIRAHDVGDRFRSDGRVCRPFHGLGRFWDRDPRVPLMLQG